MLNFFMAVLLSVTSPLMADSLPKSVGLVNDFAHILNKPDGDRLEDFLRLIKKDDGPEIAAITVPNLQGMSPSDFAKRFLDEWKIGNKHGGVVMLIAMKERQIIVRTNNAAARWLSNSDAQSVYEDYIKPSAKSGQFGTGLQRGAERIYDLYKASAAGAAPTTSGNLYGEQVKKPVPDDSELYDEMTRRGLEEQRRNRNQSGNKKPLVFVLIIAVIIMLVFILRWALRSNKNSGSIAEALNISATKPKKLNAYQRKLRNERLARERLKREEEKKIAAKKRIQEKKARLIAKTLKKRVRVSLKKMDYADRKKATGILRSWKKASKTKRRWVAKRIPSMNKYVSVQRYSNGFGITDFLFWHWVLFQPHNTYASSDSSYSGYSSSSSSSSYEPSSSSWSSPSFGSSSDSGGFSGGGSSDSGSSGGGDF
jgi:uncharacterized membrane protein YgcG